MKQWTIQQSIQQTVGSSNKSLYLPTLESNFDLGKDFIFSYK